MKTFAQALIGTTAAGAMALTAVVPAQAQGRDYRDRDGISAGEIIAGALVIGGIAAVASATSRNRYDDRYYDGGRGWDRDYRRSGYGDPRSAVEQCVYAAERSANRYSWGGRAKVTDIRDVDRKRDGYVVKGRIAVNQQGRDWRRGDSRYGRGWDNDYRGWNDNLRGFDSGTFRCRVEQGRIVDLDYGGLRGL